MVLNLGMSNRRLSFPTRSDQCKAGPAEVDLTAAQQSTKSGPHTIRRIPPRKRSMLRFHAGRPCDEKPRRVVPIGEKRSAQLFENLLREGCPGEQRYDVKVRALGGAPGPLMTRL